MFGFACVVLGIQRRVAGAVGLVTVWVRIVLGGSGAQTGAFLREGEHLSLGLAWLKNACGHLNFCK